MAEREVPEGYRLEWVPDPAWRLANSGVLCRKCRKLAVAALGRKHSGRNPFDNIRWWHYCEDHLYGRRIRDGIVEFERMVEIDAGDKPLATKEGRDG